MSVAQGPRRARRVRRLAAAALAVTAVTGCATESEPPLADVPTPAATAEYHAPTPAAESWIAFAAGGFPDTDIMLTRPGEPSHRIIGSDDDGIAEACPAFAPGSSRLAFGEATGDHDAGWANAALVIADVTAEGEAPVWWRIGLGDLKHMPCPVWSPDGRWIAFGADHNFTGGGNAFRIVDGVQLFDTATEEIRRLTDLDATDIEWAPDGSELYIADASGILVYSLADAQTRTLPETALTQALTVSPDGKSLVTERRRMNSAERHDLWLMNADGSDPRILVGDYVKMHGLGPVWSPDGRHVVFQRSCDTITDGSGNSRACSEESDVVLATVTEGDPAGPIGTQQVIPPPQTVDGAETWWWTPYAVTWSPDGTSLLYLAWGMTDPMDYEAGYVEGLLSVSASDQTPPVALYMSPDPGYGDMGVYMAFPMNNFQSWTAP